MVLKIAQFRYYGKNNLKQDNFPVDIGEKEELCYNFSNYPYKQKIIIHTIPGTNVFLNYLDIQPWNEGSPFTIGQSGILEIFTKNNLTDNEKNQQIYENNSLKLTSLKLDNISKKIIDNLNNGYFIITIIYYDTEEEKEV